MYRAQSGALFTMGAPPFRAQSGSTGVRTGDLFRLTDGGSTRPSTDWTKTTSQRIRFARKERRKDRRGPRPPAENFDSSSSKWRKLPVLIAKL